MSTKGEIKVTRNKLVFSFPIELLLSTAKLLLLLLECSLSNVCSDQ